jgi:hypothetical protein
LTKISLAQLIFSLARMVKPTWVTEIFFFGTFGGSLLGSGSLGCGEGVKLNGGEDCVDYGVGRSWRGDG